MEKQINSTYGSVDLRNAIYSSALKFSNRYTQHRCSN